MVQKKSVVRESTFVLHTPSPRTMRFPFLAYVRASGENRVS